MPTFVLIPGAGGAASYWYRVVPLLEAAGHEAIAVELPGNDESAGLDEYAKLTVAAIGGPKRRDVILVAQSLGGFTAPLVAKALPDAVRALVFVNAMIPNPGETSGAWWDNTGSGDARAQAAKANGYSADFDLDTYFLHDVPPDIAKVAERDARPQSKAIFAHPCTFDRWPDIPTRVIVGTDDRFFPRDFQHRVARERLGPGVAIEDIRGGHLVALSNPQDLFDRLLDVARSARA